MSTFAAVAALGACGSDDDAQAACDSWIAADTAIIGFLFNQQGSADSVNAAIDTAIADADNDIEDTLTQMKELAQPQLADPENEEAPDELLGLYSDAIDWAGENCDVEKVDVTATDYHFAGLPESLDTGYHVVTLTNEGTEAHEIFTFKVNDGVTESIDEIFEMPQEEVFTRITPINAGFAMPGQSDTISWNITEPGKYASVCFVPVGSVDGAEGTGPPHFTQGMVHEFEVT